MKRVIKNKNCVKTLIKDKTGQWRKICSAIIAFTVLICSSNFFALVVNATEPLGNGDVIPELMESDDALYVETEQEYYTEELYEPENFEPELIEETGTLDIIDNELESVVITKQPESVTAVQDTDVEWSIEAAGNGLCYDWQFMSAASLEWTSFNDLSNGQDTLKIKADLGLNGCKIRCVVTDEYGYSVNSDEVLLIVEASELEIFGDNTENVDEGVTLDELFVVEEGNNVNTDEMIVSEETESIESISETNDEGELPIVETENRSTEVIVSEENESIEIAGEKNNEDELIISEDINLVVSNEDGSISSNEEKNNAEEQNVTKKTIVSEEVSTSDTDEDSAESNSGITSTNDEQGVVKENSPSTELITSNVEIEEEVFYQSMVLITKQPEAVTVAPNTYATFNIEASGEGTLVYNWEYKTAKEGAKWNKISGGNGNATLHRKVTQTWNGWMFRCTVTDGNGNTEISDEVLLTVQEPLQITKQPEAVTVAPNTYAQFSIEASGEGTLVYNWQYKTAKEGAKWNKIAGGNGNATLHRKVTQTWNGWMFRCVVTDANGNTVISDEVLLTVQEFLQITKQPEAVTVAPNTYAQFSIEASGEGLGYEWQYKTAKEGAKWNKISGGNGNATLQRKVGLSWNGWMFRCVVTDGNGNTVISDEVLLTVQEFLQITKQPEAVTVAPNTYAQFSIEASGEGLGYEWQYKTAKEGAKWNKISGGNGNATLHRKVTQTWNGWMFRCAVTDANGNTVISDEVLLTVQEFLQITKQPEAVTVAPNTYAQFSIEASGEGLGYEWQYKTAKEGAKWNKISGGNGNATLQRKVGLSWNGWMFRCVVTDGNGNTVISDEVLLTVQEFLQITKQPEAVTVAPNTYAQFSIEASGEGLGYEWQYKTAKEGAKWNKISGGNGNATLQRKVGLSWNGWMFRCVVTDANGNTAISDEVLLTVQDYVVDDVIYEKISDTTCCVKSYNGTSSSLIIPNTVEGMTVTEIAPEAFMGNENLQVIDLPNSITIIGARAFKNCSNLSSMKTH